MNQKAEDGLLIPTSSFRRAAGLCDNLTETTFSFPWEGFVRMAWGARWLLMGMFVLGAESLPTRAAELSHSNSVAISRTHQARLDEVQTSLKAKRFAEAMESLQRLLDNEPEFVSNGSVIESSHGAARRLLEALPAEWRARYEDQFGGIAREKFDAARSQNDLSALRQVAEQYRLTRAGRDALRWLALRHFDHGEFLLAATGFRAACEHPLNRHLAAREHLAADVWRWVLALSRAGLSQEAARVAARYPAANKKMRVGRDTSRTLAEWLASTASGRLGTRVPHHLPSVRALWRRSTALPASSRNLLEEARDELDHRGFLSLPSGQPVVVRELVIARTLQEIVACDLNTGEVRWRVPSGSQTVELAENLALMANPRFREMISGQLAVAALADRNAGTLTHDGSRLFAVLNDHRHEGFLDVPAWNLNEAVMTDWHARRLSCCQLLALDAQSGRELWRFPRVLAHRDPALPTITGLIRDPQPDVFFFGPPCPLDQALYVIGQKERDVRLYVLSAETGEVEWFLPLVTATLPLTKEPARRRLACPVTASGGLLLCPTGTGALAAVDPLTRTCRWIARYPRDDVPAISPDRWLIGNQEGSAHGDRWWDGWREVRVIVEDQTVLWVSPESDVLHAALLETGSPLWNVPRLDGVFLEPGAAGQVLVIGRESIRVLRVKDGQILKTIPIPPPAGRGVRISSLGEEKPGFSEEAGLLGSKEPHYLLPLETGGLVVLDVQRGTARQTFPFDRQPLGNLFVQGNTWIAQTSDQLLRLSPLEVAKELPTDPKKQIAWAEAQREAGRFREAVAVYARLWEAAPTPALRQQWQETLLAELTVHPERAGQVLAELEPLLNDAESRIRAWQQLAEAEQQQKPHISALELWLRLLEENPAGEQALSDDPFTRARFSRLIQGAIIDLLDAASPSTRLQLEDRLTAYRETALASRDPFAPSRLAGRLDQLRWGRELLVQNDQRAGLGRNVLERQLSLLALTQDDGNRPLQAAAFRRLSEEWSAELRWPEAAWAAQSLRDQLADAVFPDGQPVAAWLNALSPDSPLAKAMRSDPPDAWPLTPPRRVEQPSKGRLPEFLLLPVDSQPGSLCQTLDVWLDPSRGRLRFQGGDQQGFWELALPRPKISLPIAGMISRGWGVGPLLILREGGNLFGIAPFDETGEPRPRVLWHVRMLPDDDLGERRSDALRLRVRQPPAGFGEPELRLTDSFGQSVAAVGPVTAGMVVYQSRGRVVAVEPATGKKLWSRENLPPAAQTVGDAAFVLLLDGESPLVTVLRALDGRQIAMRSRPTSGRLLTWMGHHALFQEGTDETPQLRWWDAVTGNTVWQRELAKGTLPFAIDGERLGLITPSGDVTILHAKTGTPLAVSKLQGVRNPTQVYVTFDAQRFYLGITHPPDDPNDQPDESTIVEDLPLRHPIFKGTLRGFDRRTGEATWQSRWGEWALPLDQPAGGPFLVLFHREERPGQEGAHSVVRCLDKCTGREVYHQKSPAFSQPALWLTHQEQSRFELQTPAKTVQFQFD